MTLLIDRRAEVNGPGVHALIAGCGWYPHVKRPREQVLTSAVPTARRVYDWLDANQARLPVPLATVRMLLSDGPVDDKEPESKIPRCTLDNFVRAATEWRRDASGHRESVTWLYLVGYGLELNHEQVFLLQDFGDGIGPALRHAVNISHILQGLSPSATDIGVARTQWYFLDLGREHMTDSLQWESASLLWDIPRPGLDDREAGVFYSSEAGAPGYGIEGGYTLFGDALLQCLDGAEGAAVLDDDRRWSVRVTSLAAALQRALDRRTQNYGITQRVVVSGSIRQGVLCYLEGPPQIEIRIQFESPVTGRLLISDDSGEVIFETDITSGSETIVRLLAGVYGVQFKDAAGRSLNRLIVVSTPTTLQMKAPA